MILFYFTEDDIEVYQTQENCMVSLNMVGLNEGYMVMILSFEKDKSRQQTVKA